MWLINFHQSFILLYPYMSKYLSVSLFFGTETLSICLNAYRPAANKNAEEQILLTLVLMVKQVERVKLRHIMRINDYHRA